MQQAILKASDGLTIRDPETLRPLSEAGEIKPLNAYWLRRLAEGDVIEIESAAESPSAEAKEDEAEAPPQATPKRRKP